MLTFVFWFFILIEKWLIILLVILLWLGSCSIFDGGAYICSCAFFSLPYSITDYIGLLILLVNFDLNSLATSSPMEVPYFFLFTYVYKLLQWTTTRWNIVIEHLQGLCLASKGVGESRFWLVSVSAMVYFLDRRVYSIMLYHLSKGLSRDKLFIFQSSFCLFYPDNGLAPSPHRMLTKKNIHSDV